MLQFQFRVIIIKMSVYSPLYACSLTHALIHASCALMLMCRNSPLWQCCEHCNNVLSLFWPPWLAQTWSIEQHTLIGATRKLAAYHYTSSSTLWTTLEYKLVDANWVCQGILKVRVEPATRSAVATCNELLKKVTRCRAKRNKGR